METTKTRFTIIKIFILLLIISVYGCKKEPGSGYETDFNKYFKGYNGCFVLYDFNNKYYIRHNKEQCNKRLSPCSTFKIPNSLIALETGVANDENFTLKWDSTKYMIGSWNQDHTLKSAIANSVVWYYKEIARRIGEQRMNDYFKKINYGNNDISGGIDKFWLMSTLKISANEQVEFILKLLKNELPFSERTVKIVKDIIILEKTDLYTFSGKTGSSGMDEVNNKSQGWFVGYILLGTNAYAFATNIEGEGDNEANGKRAKEITIDILKSLKIM